MFIIDRYVLRLFAKVLMISFLSFTGLYVVIDTFSNLDEFLAYGEKQGSLLAVLGQYYGVRTTMFFDRISPLLALVAAMFTITWLQRTNELTALMAAGISKLRVIMPLMAAVVAVSLLGAANRELLIPTFRDQLNHNAQDLSGEKQKPLQPKWDIKTDIQLGGRYTIAKSKQISKPRFQIDTPIGNFGRQITAKIATYIPPQNDKPGGYLLEEVSQPENLQDIDTGSLNGKPVIFSPRDTPWLEANQCFVVSDIDFEQLAASGAWQQFSSTRQLINALQNPSLDFEADMRVTIHARMVQPLLDVT